MSFQFTFLGFKYSNSSPTCKSPETKTMAKKKLTPQQKKFKTAQERCHKKESSSRGFGDCMKKELTKKKR